MTSRLLTAASAVALTVGVLAPAPAAIAAPGITFFHSCAAIHRVYPGGIAKKGVHVNTTHYRGETHHRLLKGRVEFSTALYLANRKRDRDRDGIACELSGGRRID